MGLDNRCASQGPVVLGGYETKVYRVREVNEQKRGMRARGAQKGEPRGASLQGFLFR